MRFIRVKPSASTTRRYKDVSDTHVTRATLWPVNDVEAVHDGATRSGRLDSEPYPQNESWIRRVMKGLRNVWESF